MRHLRLIAFIAPLLISIPCFAQGNAKADRVVVTKSERTLTLERNGEPIRIYAVALGAHPAGHKRQQGDERTPEGVYSIDARNPDSAYHLSLRISYPNEEDRQRAAARGVDPGGEIMIHGMGSAVSRMGPLHPHLDWTDGCVAVTDEEMDEIWKLVDIGTPIEIKP
ncbi:MAG: L,D-transpeptidase family protein [Gammaproteobacteria bacterium]|nr:L,D-transpeptidase family protein [Gammaproteobacteria bacterium]